jgi:hypothetical protein
VVKRVGCLCKATALKLSEWNHNLKENAAKSDCEYLDWNKMTKIMSSDECLPCLPRKVCRVFLIQEIDRPRVVDLQYSNARRSTGLSSVSGGGARGLLDFIRAPTLRRPPSAFKQLRINSIGLYCWFFQRIVTFSTIKISSEAVLVTCASRKNSDAFYRI